MATNIMAEHFKEMAELKRRQKKEWSELLKNQEKTLIENDNVAGMAVQFAKERDEHNERFSKEKSELIRRQQQELSAFKENRQNERTDEGMEM